MFPPHNFFIQFQDFQDFFQERSAFYRTSKDKKKFPDFKEFRDKWEPCKCHYDTILSMS